MLAQRHCGFRKERHQPRARRDVACQATTIQLLLLQARRRSTGALRSPTTCVWPFVRVRSARARYPGVGAVRRHARPPDDGGAVHGAHRHPAAGICRRSVPRRPVVLVVDGVDECPADARPAFLAALRAGVLHLPASVKIFLASRPRGDVRAIVEALAPLDVHLAVGAGRDDGDIELFLQRELLQICEAGGLERKWSPLQIKKDAGALSAKAGGLFQWAKLATALLGDQTRPREMIARILSVADESEGVVSLDALYAEALSIAVPAQAQDKDLRTLYLHVIGTVVAAQEPLTISAICTLLNASGVGCDASTVRALLENLGSVIVLRRIRGGAVVVRIGHPSFSEYVTSPQRCPPAWYIDLQRASAQLGSRCFSLMAKSLKRDICGMHGPSMTNKGVSSATIYQNITTGLRYACGHAFVHISGDRGNWRLLETFLMEKLLEWLEAVSLLGLLDTAVELLRHALAELEQEKSHTSSVEILQDAIRFIGRFGSVINKSAMNIYFSALPFAPQNTTLYRVYAARYRDIPRVTLGYLESWPEELCTVRNLGGDETSPRRLAFSADSSRLALSTPTHLVTASPLTGIQLGGKYRLGSTDVEPPIALACRPAYLASITSGLVLRTVDARSLKDVQLSLPPASSFRHTFSRGFVRGLQSERQHAVCGIPRWTHSRMEAAPILLGARQGQSLPITLICRALRGCQFGVVRICLAKGAEDWSIRRLEAG
ncbi:hypothetical protein H4582DRAFT_88202 [Lactarius indigo]|nr:hypothetical protein H4582DRAFT_88202 [Lactarius indigo]